MSFGLSHCGDGCYSLLLDGSHIGAVFAADEGDLDERWVALIHESWTSDALPHPFTTREHCFPTFEDLKDWLGLPPVPASA
jgi:hypothetical protein